MGLYTITTRADGTVLTGGGSASNIFNVDHQNHVTHTAAPYVNSFEADVTQMNLETDPAPAGVVSFSAALSDELRRLRFSLHQIKSNINAGTAPAHWYTPVTPGDALVMGSHAARLEMTALQSIPDSVSTTALFQVIAYDRGSDMANVLTAGTYDGLHAPQTGIYAVGASLGLDGNLAPRTFELSLFRDTDAVATDQTSVLGPNDTRILNVESVLALTAGQIIRLKIFHTPQFTSGPRNVTLNPTPALWMALIGR